MPVCAFDAVVVSSTNQPTRVNNVQGATVIARSGADHNTFACDYVLLTTAEYNQIYNAVLAAPTGGSKDSGSLLDLSPEQATLVGGAVFGVWAIAWAAKQAIRTLRGSDEKID